VNGKKVVHHLGGYLPVVFDFTDAASRGKMNTVLVRLDNTDNPVTGPKPMRSLDFNMYGGLYRDAFLIIKDPLHISDPVLANKPASGGVFVTYPNVTKEEAIVQIKTNVRNDNPQEKEFIILNEIWKGKTLIDSQLSNKIKVDPNKDIDVTENLTVKQPDLWSPKSPSLYSLKTKVLINRKLVDITETKIGIHRFEIKKEGFFINGK
jgi:beta-galactosidase